MILEETVIAFSLAESDGPSPAPQCGWRARRGVEAGGDSPGSLGGGRARGGAGVGRPQGGSPTLSEDPSRRSRGLVRGVGGAQECSRGRGADPRLKVSAIHPPAPGLAQLHRERCGHSGRQSVCQSSRQVPRPAPAARTCSSTPAASAYCPLLPPAPAAPHLPLAPAAPRSARFEHG